MIRYGFEVRGKSKVGILHDEDYGLGEKGDEL
jgi:hypothetical protein